MPLECPLKPRREVVKACVPFVRPATGFSIGDSSLIRRRRVSNRARPDDHLGCVTRLRLHTRCQPRGIFVMLPLSSSSRFTLKERISKIENSGERMDLSRIDAREVSEFLSTWRVTSRLYIKIYMYIAFTIFQIYRMTFERFSSAIIYVSWTAGWTHRSWRDYKRFILFNYLRVKD